MSDLGELVELFISHEGDGPMNKIEVEIFELKFLESLTKSGLHMSWVVVGVPELAGMGMRRLK